MHNYYTGVDLKSIILTVTLQWYSYILGLMPLFYFLTVSPNDYDEVVDFLLSFAVGDKIVCHNVTIYDDNQCEQPAELFLSRLSYVSGEMPITIVPEIVPVFIR